MLEQVAFIVWRESIEALLVIGILFAWLKQNPDFAAGRKYLWAGVAGGLLAAVLLGATLLGFASWLEEGRDEYFQIAMMLLACGLIVQMVFWMRKHGRTLKRELETGLAANAQASRWWGMALLVVVAIAREGSETVVFLYGMGLGQSGVELLNFTGAAALGFALALLVFWLLQQGGKVITWQRFFRITEIMLLLLACAMLVNSIERMIGLDWLPTWYEPVWDTSAWLDDSSRLGNLVASFTGYRAAPSLMLLTWVVAYWGLITLAFKRR
ncbi:MAG: hypothetical protein RL217_299 [Pseudomonadota bacterium]|jgi:high-affinity iron transporter